MELLLTILFFLLLTAGWI